MVRGVKGAFDAQRPVWRRREEGVAMDTGMADLEEHVGARVRA